MEKSKSDEDRRLREAALAAKDLYEADEELVDWTCLDAEEFLDDSVSFSSE